MRFLIAVLVFCLVAPAAANETDGPFILRSTSKSLAQVVEDIRAYSKKSKWLYLGDTKVKRGAVRLVKICIPEVGRAVWKSGLQLSALLPCGNIGVYRKGNVTEISVLHPRYMHVLHPDPATKTASKIALPLLQGLLNNIAP